MEHWSTAQAAAQDRFDAWTAALGATHLPWRMRPPRSADFHAELQSLQTDTLSIVNCRCAPCAGYRDPAAIRGAEDGLYGVLILRSGRERVRQGDQAFELGAGSALIWDSARPIEFEVLEPLDKCTLFIGKDMLHRHTGRSDLPLGLLNSRQGFGALLWSRVAALDSLMTDFDGAARHALGLALLQDLANSAHGIERPSPSGARQSLLLRIGRLVEAHYADAEFGPVELAAMAGVSLRYLHQLFQDEGETVAARIQRLRLEAVRADLADPALAGLSITQIGFARGFSSSAHLSRSFRARFDMSPRDYRTAQLSR